MSFFKLRPSRMEIRKPSPGVNQNLEKVVQGSSLLIGSMIFQFVVEERLAVPYLPGKGGPAMKFFANKTANEVQIASPGHIRTWDCPFMNAKEIAEILSISPQTVYLFNSCNRMPKASKFGRSVRWRRSEILQSIEDGTFGRFQK